MALSRAGSNLDLVASLGLVTAGVDLRRALDGQYYCFEVNPAHGFMFYQQYTGQRISDALVDRLVGGLSQRFSSHPSELCG
jgi:glutathione synthase/RimK-type ligase-like ATP-grasp enzyme